MIKIEDKLLESNIVSDKLTYNGASSLTDAQLLGIIIGRGEIKESHIDKAKQLINNHKTLENIFSADKLSVASNVHNLLKCTQELVHRLKKEDAEIEFIENNHDAEKVLRPLFKGAQSEEFWVVTLNRAGRIIEKRCLSKGGLSSSLVDIKIVMKYVLGTLASSVLIAHNHPSGDVAPSGDDLEITQKLVSALSFFDIVLIDHIIIGAESSYSFREKQKI